MVNMAKQAKLRVDDSTIIEEFKIIQQQTLNDIRRLCGGQRALSDHEVRVERTKEINKKQESRIQNLINKQKEEQEKASQTTERIVKLIGKSKNNLQAGIEFEQQDKKASQRDKICLAVLVLIWMAILLYSHLYPSSYRF